MKGKKTRTKCFIRTKVYLKGLLSIDIPRLAVNLKKEKGLKVEHHSKHLIEISIPGKNETICVYGIGCTVTCAGWKSEDAIKRTMKWFLKILRKYEYVSIDEIKVSWVVCYAELRKRIGREMIISNFPRAKEKNRAGMFSVPLEEGGVLIHLNGVFVAHSFPSEKKAKEAIEIVVSKVNN